MWICLLILSIVFVTVPLFISLITDFLDKNEIELSWLSKESVTTYIATFAAFIVNLTLIPYCIYFMSLMEDWKVCLYILDAVTALCVLKFFVDVMKSESALVNVARNITVHLVALFLGDLLSREIQSFENEIH